MKRSRIFCVLFLLLLLVGCGKKESMVLAVSGGDFTITSAEGKSLRCSGGFSGDLTVNRRQGGDADAGELEWPSFLEVAGGKGFTCQWDAAGGQKFGLLPNYSMDGGAGGGESLREYTLSGDRLERASITAEGMMEADSGEDGLVEAAFSLPCGALGSHGFVRFSGAAGDRVSVRPDEAGSRFSFSGFLPGDCVLSYAGEQSDPWVSVTLEAGSGTIDLSGAAEGRIILQEDGREARVLGESET